ncbi:MAG: phosphoglycerate kinase [Hyphomicrobiales bacterium]
MSAFRTLDDVTPAGRRVLVRVDLNVPLENGAVGDRTRIERVVPTLRELSDAGAIVIVLSHFGRPRGKVAPDMSLAPVCGALAETLGRDVTFVATDWLNGRAAAAVERAGPGDVLLMENTRFHPGEEGNDKEFAGRLAALGDLYVNDAFSAAHRAHASTEGVAHLLPAVAGRAMQAELEALGRALEAPERPVAAVVGGAKISTKLDLLGALSARVDSLIIGGGMANTFLAAQGKPVGKSLCEHDLLATAREIVTTAEANGCALILPSDVVAAEAFEPNAAHRIVPADQVGDDDMILDVGPETIALVTQVFERSRTLVWNGPLGAFELTPFDRGTNRAAQAAADLTGAGKLLTVAGGGDTVAALNTAGVAGDFSYISTAGGAFLEWLEGKALPGVVVLQQGNGPRSTQSDLERVS